MYSNNGLQEVPIFQEELSMSEDCFTLPEFSDYSLFEDCLEKKHLQSSNQHLGSSPVQEIVKVEEDDYNPVPQQANTYYQGGNSSCRYAQPSPQQQQTANINQQQPINQQMVQQQMGPQMCPPQQQQPQNNNVTTPPGYPYAPSPAYPGGAAPVPEMRNTQPSPQYEQAMYNNNNNNNSPANYSPASPYSSSLGSPNGNQSGEDFMPLRQALFNRHAASMNLPQGSGAAPGYGIQFGAFYEQQMLDGKRRKHDFELTPEEYEKRRLRRERNKQAALRCRQRRRERIEELEKETAKIEEENASQRSEIQRLEKQVSELMKMLKEHQCGRPIETPACAQPSQAASSTTNVGTLVASTMAPQACSSTSVIQQAVPLSRSVRTLSTFDINVKNEN